MDQIILVTGTPRSGISVLGGILHACGAGSGGSQGHPGSGGRARYQAGAFQSRDLHRLTVGPLLSGMGADPRGQAPLPDPAAVREIASRAAGSLRIQVDTFFALREPRRPLVFFADPGLALLWPIWREAYPLAPWIVVRRAIPEIVDSCLSTRWMNAYQTRADWERWALAYEERFGEIPGRIDVWPSELLAGDAGGVKAAIETVGLTWDNAAVQAYLAPVLWQRGTYGLRGGTDGV